MNAIRILDRVIRPAPIGLRFRDVATGLTVGAGLTVTVTSLRNPLRMKRLDVNRSGVWYAHRFPGFSDHDLADPANWPALAQPCRVSVDDALGRFLPLRIDMDLPIRGLANWPGWNTVPQALLAPLIDGASESPPDMTVCRDALPLFSAPERGNPAPLAEIRCQLRRTDGEPATGAMMTVSHSGTERALGQADADGRVAMFFPYPERPRASLATSPPAITDFRWSLDIRAYAAPLPATPTFADLIDQLNHPRDLFASTVSPPELLPSQLLSFGRPLTLRTTGSSVLMMASS
jgi:hypothetical protein